MQFYEVEDIIRKLVSIQDHFSDGPENIELATFKRKMCQILGLQVRNFISDSIYFKIPSIENPILASEDEDSDTDEIDELDV